MKAVRRSSLDLKKRDLTTRIFAGLILYVREYFPNVDLEAVSLEAGLPLSYLLSDRWVSAEFALRFTKLCIERTGDSNILRKAGEVGIIADLTGKAFFRLITAILAVDTMYAQLTRLTQMFNRVTRVDVVQGATDGKSGQITYKLSFDPERRTEFSKEMREELLRSVLESSLGYYSALPTAKGLPKAKVDYTESSEDGDKIFFITIRFSNEAKPIGVPITALGATLYIVSCFWPMQYLGPIAVTVLVIGGILKIRESSKKSQATLQTTLEALEISDTRYVEVINAQKQTEALANSYSRFVPWEFFHQMGKESVLQVELGTQRQVPCGVCFADIRNFTSISEELGTEKTFQLLNSILADITPAVSESGGFVDTFLGDGVMALFPGENGGARALQAARKMQALLSQYRSEKRYSVPIHLAVGVHQGTVSIGTIGNASQMRATVIGDPVNVAARLQEFAKERGLLVAASSEALESLPHGEAIAYHSLETVQLRGRRVGLHVFGLSTQEASQTDAEAQVLQLADARSRAQQKKSA